MNYLPYYSNPYQQTQDERIWVQGVTSAEAYLVAPGGFVRLWDSLEPVFYEKRADATGRPMPMEIYEYKRREAQKPVLLSEGGIDLKEEIEALKSRLDALENGSKKEVKKNVSKSNADGVGIPEV